MSNTVSYIIRGCVFASVMTICYNRLDESRIESNRIESNRIELNRIESLPGDTSNVTLLVQTEHDQSPITIYQYHIRDVDVRDGIWCDRTTHDLSQ